MDETFWMAGISTDPTDPFGADLFCHTDRTVTFAWLIGGLSEYAGSEPYITDVSKALATPDQGIVVAFSGSEDEVESEVRGFAMPMTLYGLGT